ncbi:hypothetical protein SMTE5_14470 [Serratia marcescens]|nr:hypothetical protein SMTE5_14470 [Serratia marcescens]
MIDIAFIHEEFGINPPLPESIVQSSLRFMIAFYYCENKFFQRYCQFNEVPNYAQNIIQNQKEDPSNNIDLAFQFFHKRYSSNVDANNRRFALVSSLTNPKKSLDTIEESLLQAEADHDPYSKLIASLYIIVRLRHNLFHANKYEAINDDPEGQRILLDNATNLLGYLLKNS